MPHQIFQVVDGHCAADVAARKERIGQIAFGFVEAQDFLLDGVARNQVIDGHVLVLPDAVGAVGGLLLDGGIPPRVQVDDVVGVGQVEAQSAGFQADEEHGHQAVLEVGHHLLALADGRGTVQIENLVLADTRLDLGFGHIEK